MLQDDLLKMEDGCLPSERERRLFYSSIFRILSDNGMILSLGNGGSMVQAQHLAEELSGKFDKPRRALNSFAITDPSFITCVANDFGFEQIFSRAVEAHCRVGDGVVLFSTSGQSPNLLRAANTASLSGIRTFAFLGREGSPLEQEVDACLTLGDSVPRHLIQVIHTLWIHELLIFIEDLLSDE